MLQPYEESKTSENTLHRIFRKDVETAELEWHVDEEFRTVKVISDCSAWSIQFDNSIPIVLSKDLEVEIPAWHYHRLIRRHDCNEDLHVEIVKHKQN